MTTEHQIAYSSHTKVTPDQRAASIKPPKEKQSMHKEDNNAKSNVSERHHSFSSTYPQTKNLHNILSPLLITTTALILFQFQNNLDHTLPNHSKLAIGWSGASCATSKVTTAIAKADWSTMDADHHDVIFTALASLGFKDASHTESSSCSWLGLRDECLDLSLQKCQKKYWSSLYSILLVVRQQEHELVKQKMWDPLSVWCSLQVPTRQLRLSSHTAHRVARCWVGTEGKRWEREEYKSKLLCFAPSLRIPNQDLALLT